MFKFKKPKNEIDNAIQAFLKGEIGKFGKYCSLPNALVYRTIITEQRQSKQSLEQNIIAVRLENGILLGNSSILPLIGRRSSFGHETLNRNVTEVQEKISQYIPMIPFNVFTEAGLNINKFEFVERGKEENITRKRVVYNAKKRKDETKIEKVHFTGASVFKVNDKYFLFDADRRELKHKIFNPFLVELNNPVKSIKEAYESLKPVEVIEAEKQGLKVKRQGKWFFIPVERDNFIPVIEEVINWKTNKKEVVNRRLELRAGQNRPNYAEMFHEPTKYVSGKIEHSGREHADLVLKGWYKPVPNTSVQSFTITGDID